eukprot:GHUV01052505.1.p1 GENE.GHUV01052505.1~~GHUV01052505.1.p1  ORF type:complete len:110 (+),score=5.81 GHUV01052505.1:159-488(+)
MHGTASACFVAVVNLARLHHVAAMNMCALPLSKSSKAASWCPRVTFSCCSLTYEWASTAVICYTKRSLSRTRNWDGRFDNRPSGPLTEVCIAVGACSKHALEILRLTIG